MKNIFINPSTQIIRAGWRILIFVAIFLTLNLGLTFGIRAILGSLRGGGTLWFVLLGFSATIASYLTTKFITKESFVNLGLQWKFAIKDIIMGIVISALIMSIMYILLLVLGYIEFNGFSWWN